MNGTRSRTADAPLFRPVGLRICDRHSWRGTTMFKGLGQLGDMAKMMKAAKEMQERMMTLQEDLGRIVVVGEAGAGLVQARATAKGELTGLSIDPSILVASEKEVVEDLILAAIKDAQARAAARAQDEQRKLLTEMGLPADMNLPPV
ncbi:Nucleoid-associated protein YbaB [bioreactor metagenome]